MSLVMYEILNGPEIQEKYPRKHCNLTFSYSAGVCSEMPRETPWIVGNYFAFSDWISLTPN